MPLCFPRPQPRDAIERVVVFGFTRHRLDALKLGLAPRVLLEFTLNSRIDRFPRAQLRAPLRPHARAGFLCTLTQHRKLLVELLARNLQLSFAREQAVVHSFARDVPMSETYRGVVPYLAADAVRITLVFVFPALSLWLVGILT